MLDTGALDRFTTLTDYGLMDSGREATFDTIVAHAAQITAAPISTISLIDDKRQWFKARIGIDHDGSDLQDSICATVVRGRGTMVVPDARLDRRFRDIRPVVGDPGIRFYAGTPLTLRNGVQVGTLCVVDVQPREGLADDERDALERLARRTVAAIEVRQRARVRWAFQGNLGSIDALMRAEALTALLTASAALEAMGDLLPVALLDEVIERVEASIDRQAPVRH